MAFFGIAEVTSKTMPTMDGITTISNGTCVARADYRVAATIDATKLSKECAEVVDN